ncbi:MAG: hypothetical protein QOF66_7894 [Mycobacterium sp.]|jgi:hypothetical protein|nr:hypothetical protein [Mycobacterium sp.]
MMESERPAQSRFAAALNRWRGFWFAPEPVYTLGLVRMAFGALAVLWTLSLFPDLHELFGVNGPVPQQPTLDYRWGIFQVWTGDTAISIGWVVLLLSAIAVAVGWHSRLAAILVFVLLTSFMRRDPWIFTAGDGVISVTALYLALSSCGAALSLDQRRRTGSFWTAQCRAPWPIRLMQVQLSVIYLVSVQAKLSGKPWVGGYAVAYAWRTDYKWAILPAPQWMSENAIIVNVATWGTLAIELAIAILIWNRRLRPWVLAAGVLLHLMILLSLNVGFFSPAMFVLYLAFVSWETVQRMPTLITRAWSRLRGRGRDGSDEGVVSSASAPAVSAETPSCLRGPPRRRTAARTARSARPPGGRTLPEWQP